MKWNRLNGVKVCIIALCLILSFGIFGCSSIQLIAPYDQKTDAGVTDLQKKTAEFFTQIERKGGSKPGDYKNHTQFYDDVKVSLSSLVVRSSAISLNTQTTKELDILTQQYQQLEQDDKKQGIPQAAVPQYEAAFNRTFTAILTLEVAKKAPKAGGTGK